MFPLGVLRALIVAIVLAAPLVPVLRKGRDQKLTWTTAILLGSWLTAITVVLIGDVPSRILYWFDETHAQFSERYSFLRWQEEDLGGNPGYQVIADIVANTIQGMFFVAICAGAYFWGQKHRKDGKFKS
ncbi:MAG: hypothetical protein WD646_09305 [Actinomycetota bacterium]